MSEIPLLLDTKPLRYWGGSYVVTLNKLVRDALDNANAALRLNPKSPYLLFNAAIVYQQLGDTQLALEVLEKAVAAGISPATLRDTPNFDGLWANPRYLKLVPR